MSLSELMIEIPAEYEANVFGQFDVYVKKLERTFHVTLISAMERPRSWGERAAAEKVQRILNQLVELARRGNTITEQNVDYAISLVFEDQEQQLVPLRGDTMLAASPQVVVTLQGPTWRHLRNMSRSIVRSWCKPSKGRARPLGSLSPTSSIRRNPAKARSRKVRRGDEDSQRLHPGPTKR